MIKYDLYLDQFTNIPAGAVRSWLGAILAPCKIGALVGE